MLLTVPTIHHLTSAFMKQIETKINVNDKDNEFILKFDSKIYSLDIIKEAMYRFTDKCSFRFEMLEQTITVNIQFFSNISDDSKKEISQQIHNEVLDQDLRKTIAKETEYVRNLILANAFSNTKLIDYTKE